MMGREKNRREEKRMKRREEKRREEKKRKEKRTRKEVKEENQDPGARKSRKVAIHCLLPMITWLRRVEK